MSLAPTDEKSTSKPLKKRVKTDNDIIEDGYGCGAEVIVDLIKMFSSHIIGLHILRTPSGGLSVILNNFFKMTRLGMAS